MFIKTIAHCLRLNHVKHLHTIIPPPPWAQYILAGGVLQADTRSDPAIRMVAGEP